MENKSRKPPPTLTPPSKSKSKPQTVGTPVLPPNVPSDPVIVLQRTLAGAVTLARFNDLTGKPLPIPLSGDATLEMVLGTLATELSSHESFALLVGSGDRVRQVDKATPVFGRPKPGGGSDVAGPRGGGGPKGIVSVNVLSLSAGSTTAAQFTIKASMDMGMPVLTNVGFLVAARGKLKIAAVAGAGYQSFSSVDTSSAPATEGTQLYITIPDTTLVSDTAAAETTALPVNVLFDGSRPLDPALPSSALGVVEVWVYGQVSSFVTGALWLQLPSGPETITVNPA